MIKTISVLLLGAVLAANDSNGCDSTPSSDQKQHDQQEVLLQQATDAVGMPAIKNFRERKLLKDILEMRDQDGLVTYTYLFAETTGKLVFLGKSIGYGLPYATQFTNPQKPVTGNSTGALTTVAQADPNGLFSPSAAEGTWILLLDAQGTPHPLYCEPRVIVSPFPLNTN